MDDYNRILAQYNQQAQQVVNNAQGAINQQTNAAQQQAAQQLSSQQTGAQTTPASQSAQSGTPVTVPSIAEAQQAADAAQQNAVNAAQQTIQNAQAEYDQQLAQMQALYNQQTQIPGSTSGTNQQTSNTNAATHGNTATPSENPAQTQQQDTISQAEALAEWNAIMARIQAGTATSADYERLYQIYGAAFYGGTAPANTTGTATGIGTGDAGVAQRYPAVDLDYIQRINDMYDAQINAQRIALQEQGDQALSDAQANRDRIAATYQTQRNAAAVDWERQRRNFLEGANMSGLNTGAGSQAELSMMGQHQQAQNTLGAAQAQAETEADRNIADIRRSTQAAINEAVMKNDYQRAAALLDEYKDQYNRAMERAEALASFGDFSGFAALYGTDAANQMRQTWTMQNPEVALALGLITQQQYAQLTVYKQYPALALYGAGYGGGGSGNDVYGSLLAQYSAIANNPNLTQEQAAATLAEYDAFRHNYG